MLYDPYPSQMLLGPKEIQSLLGLSRSEWYEFLSDPTTGFPLPVGAGKTRSGQDRRRWRKHEVYHWIEARPRLDAQIDSPKPSETVRNRPKPSAGVADGEG